MTEALPKTGRKLPFTVDNGAPGIVLDLPVEISFECYGPRFSAVARKTPDGPMVAVEGLVGSIPFSAESAMARTQARALLALSPSTEIVRLEPAARGQIALRGEAPLGDHPSPARTVAVASAVLSAAKPLMELLREIGALSPPPAMARLAAAG